MAYEKNMELRYEFADSRIVSGLHDSSTRHPLCVLVLLRFDIVKHSICIPSFCFTNVIFFVINPCDLYPRIFGAESCIKDCLDHLDQYVLTDDQLLD